jgi:methylmalonyl-CoA mutase C-terminal domain/subunit
VLVAKVGLDGHDRGAKLVALALRDAGHEVIYAGIRQTPETIAAIAVSEDVELVGLSILSGAHSLLVPAVVDQLRKAGLDAPVVVGGIIPADDREALIAGGIALIFGPGDPMEQITNQLDALLDAGDSLRDQAASKDRSRSTAE